MPTNNYYQFKIISFTPELSCLSFFKTEILILFVLVTCSFLNASWTPLKLGWPCDKILASEMYMEVSGWGFWENLLKGTNPAGTHPLSFVLCLIILL